MVTNKYIKNMVKKKKEWTVGFELEEIVAKLKTALHFHKPRDIVEYQCPDYYQIITKPMDFQTIILKVQKQKYKNFYEFKEDHEQLF